MAFHKHIVSKGYSKDEVSSAKEIRLEMYSQFMNIKNSRSESKGFNKFGEWLFNQTEPTFWNKYKDCDIYSIIKYWQKDIEKEEKQNYE